MSVVSDHFTGYTLSIKGDNAEGSLRGSTSSLISITGTGITAETFASSTAYNNSWGFLPSKINGTDNTNYLPAPKNSPLVIDTTNTANVGQANKYTLAMGARINVHTAIDLYANTFVITATGNPPAYRINYDKNTAASVSGMPSANVGQIGVATSDPVLSNATPTRTDGYKFVGWCVGGH